MLTYVLNVRPLPLRTRVKKILIRVFKMFSTARSRN